MTNEEKILAMLQDLKAGQEKLEAGQVAMQTDIADLKAGQAKLEAGQERLETRLMGEITGLANMLADTHETIDSFRDETNKKLDYLYEETNAVKRLTTRNIYDIAKLQEKIEEPAGA